MPNENLVASVWSSAVQAPAVVQRNGKRGLLSTLVRPGPAVPCDVCHAVPSFAGHAALHRSRQPIKCTKHLACETLSKKYAW